MVKLIRRSCWLRAACGLCIGALFSTISISDANAQRRAYQAPREFEELLVIRKPGAAPHALRADCAALGAEGVGDNPKLRMHRIRVPKHRLEAVKRHLEPPSTSIRGKIRWRTAMRARWIDSSSENFQPGGQGERIWMNRVPRTSFAFVTFLTRSSG